MKCYRLNGSVAQIEELAIRTLGIKVPPHSNFRKNALRWYHYSAEHILSLEARHGQAFLLHIWSEQINKRGPLWDRCEAVKVELDLLNELNILQEATKDAGI